MTWQTTIIEKTISCSSIAVIRVKKPDAFSFHAGQYAMISLDEKDNLIRPYSIASSPRDNFLEFHVRDSHIPQGLGHQLFNCFDKNDPLYIHSVQGDIVFSPTHSNPCLMVAGGTGIAPIHSYVLTYAKDLMRPLSIFWGINNESEAYLSDFINLCQLHPFISLCICTAEESPSQDYEQGLVGSIVKNHFVDLSAYNVYVYGPPAMIDHTFKCLLERRAVVDNIYTDIRPTSLLSSKNQA